MGNIRRVTLGADDAFLLIRILEEVTVSVHRVMSRAADGVEVGVLLQQYFQEGAWRRLSEGRRVLAEILDREFGEEQITELLGEIRCFPDEG